MKAGTCSVLINDHFLSKKYTIHLDTMACCADEKRKLWSEESMEAAINGVQNENMTIREASRLYNVPFETLRRHVNGSVKINLDAGQVRPQY